MWPNSFEERLTAWTALRDNEALPLEDYLRQVNSWWHTTPWSPYYLHWDDRAEWPTPWQLLSDNVFCPVSRGLGVLYTLALSPRAIDAELVEVDNDNLVLVNHGKYTLNYHPSEIVNIKLPEVVSSHRISIEEIKNKF